MVGRTVAPFSRALGQDASNPGRDKPTNTVQLRFRFTSDQLCPGVNPHAGAVIPPVWKGREP